MFAKGDMEQCKISDSVRFLSRVYLVKIILVSSESGFVRINIRNILKEIVVDFVQSTMMQFMHQFCQFNPKDII